MQLEMQAISTVNTDKMRMRQTISHEVKYLMQNSSAEKM